MMLCKHCYYVGKPTTDVKGSMLIELALWLFFIVPGLIYSLWRLTTKQKVCPSCRTAGMIPITTPAAQVILGQLSKATVDREHQHNNQYNNGGCGY